MRMSSQAENDDPLCSFPIFSWMNKHHQIVYRPYNHYQHTDSCAPNKTTTRDDDHHHKGRKATVVAATTFSSHALCWWLLNVVRITCIYMTTFSPGKQLIFILNDILSVHIVMCILNPYWEHMYICAAFSTIHIDWPKHGHDKCKDFSATVLKYCPWRSILWVSSVGEGVVQWMVCSSEAWMDRPKLSWMRKDGWLILGSYKPCSIRGKVEMYT